MAGLRMHLGSGSDQMAIPIVSGKDFLIIREAVGPALLVPWDQLAGELHMLLANFRPDRALEVELAPYRPSSKAQVVGVFLLQSPNTIVWQFLPKTIEDVWHHFQDFRLHVLLHQLSDWDPHLWRKHLGVAFPVFGGLHWCGSVNRYPGFNRQLAESRKSDNYFNKIFMMLAIAEHQGFEWIVSVDDDVFLPPFSFMSLVRSGPMADKRGCGVVLPLTQNGIPSTETFARHWLSAPDRGQLFRCFSQSSGQFCRDGSLMHCCRGGEAVDAKEIPAVPIPEPWNEVEWYNSVAERFELRWWKNHPVSGNLTCMILALNLALKGLDQKWFRPIWDVDSLVVDRELKYPYFANNVFLMRTDRYVRVIEHPDCCHGTDERMMNQLLREEKAPLCFETQSFGIHPAWGNFGQTMKNTVESQTVSLLQDLFPAEWFAKRQWDGGNLSICDVQMYGGCIDI
ncbi:Uncharacterized protein SCF082_LOCUS13338 [Durusdinium trenchii]|uniref:Nucleotide-diphospho-sugar transferase domain-containing protein n=1 Tax=Durusdinium trenchii TaxID=1381693 RepID=A0ABP0JQV3_9DINO